MWVYASTGGRLDVSVHYGIHDWKRFAIALVERSHQRSKYSIRGIPAGMQQGAESSGARYYMSALGRWTSVDPLADEFPAWSGYHYVRNNPLALTDPTGMAPSDWYEDRDGTYKHDPEVKSQADLGEGQTYLGEEVLVKNGVDTEYLSADGSRGYVFDRETSKTESGSTGAAGFSAAMAKQAATLDAAAESGGKALETLKAGTRALSRAGTVFSFLLSSGSELAEGDPLGTYEAVKASYDVGITAASLGTGPAGLFVAGGGFLLEVSGGKERIVRGVTTQILEMQADHIVDLE